MKKSIKRRALAMLMAMAMLLTAAPATPLARAEETLSTNVTEPFFSIANIPNPSTGGTTTSNSYRIPAMVTLKDGTIVAAADTRWNTTYDGGGLDTLVARSTDGGVSWEYTMANYLGDNGNTYNGSSSTCFIDPCLTVAADGQTVYMLCDLYPYGVALNGSKDTAPVTTVGFTTQGYLKLSNDNHNSYGYYLKDGKIYSTAGAEVSGYTVDAHFNLYENGTQISNLFFANSPYKVVRTGFLYLTKSTDGGKTWSDPTLLNLKTSSEQVCLVGPGRGITTKNGTMVFPVYSFHGDNEPSGNSQRLSFVYSTDGKNWSRTAEFNHNWASEAAVVELSDGSLRFFFRNGTTNLCYVDYNLSNHTWGSAVTMSNIDTNSNTQISAITYSKTANGKQVILVSCPTGRNRAGSNSSSGGERLNGSIFVFTVDGKTMSLEETIEVNSGNSQFMYSCLTERSDGSVAILFEDKENAWGTGSNCYYTMDMKAYSASALGLTFDETTDPGEGGGTVTDGTIEMFVGDDVTLKLDGAVGVSGSNTTPDGIASYQIQHNIVPGGTTLTKVTSLTAGDQIVISDGQYFLRNDAGFVESTTNVEEATVWTVAKDGNYFTLSDNGYYLRSRNSYNGYTLNISNLSSNTDYRRWYYDSSKGFYYGTYRQYYLYTSSGNWAYNTSPNSYYGAAYKVTTTESINETTVTFKGLKPGETVATIGNATYAVIVKAKSGEVTSYLQTESVTALDVLTELGLPADAGYTVSFASDSDLVTIDAGNIITGTATGTAIVIATVQKDGIAVGTVTYTLHISTIQIDETLDVFVAIGNKASITGISGEVNTSMLDTTVATIDQADGTSLSSSTVTINAISNAENIGKHTSFVVGTTQYMIHLVPANEKNTDAAKYFRVDISQIENCTVYFAINGGQLHKVAGTGLLLDETFYDGFNLMFFAVPDEGYVLTEMTSVEKQSNGTDKVLTDYYSIANGIRPDGADSDAWPFKDNPEPTSIPSSSSDSVWVSGHGFRWCLMEGNMSIEGMRAMFTDALSKGAQGATTITKNGSAGINVEFSFVAEQLPTFKKEIISVNGQPYTEDTVIEFGNEITYRFTITSYSSNVTYTTVTIRDDLIGFVHTVPAGGLDTAGSYSVTADYTVNVADVDKYEGGKFRNEANLTYEYSSDYDTGSYEFTATASVSCDISGMVYYTWADNVPAGITGNAAAYPLPGQEVVTYNQPFQVKPYTGATEYVAVENGVAVGKWTFKGWNLAGTEYTGGETVTMSSQGSLAFEGVWEYAAYPTYTVTYQWIGAPTTGVTLPTDGGNYYSGQTYRVDGTYTTGDTFTLDGVEYTFNGWKLNGSPVSGQQTMGQSNVILVGEWTSSQLYTSLVIRKTGAQAIDVNQTFLFRIQGEGVDLTVAVHGDGYAVVEGLKVGGTYTVTEITRWSWRYAFASYTTNLPNTAAEHGATVTLGAEDNEITFTCQRIVNWWLDGDHWIDNTFTGKS